MHQTSMRTNPPEANISSMRAKSGPIAENPKFSHREAPEFPSDRNRARGVHAVKPLAPRVAAFQRRDIPLLGLKTLTWTTSLTLVSAHARLGSVIPHCSEKIASRTVGFGQHTSSVSVSPAFASRSGRRANGPLCCKRKQRAHKGPDRTPASSTARRFFCTTIQFCMLAIMIVK
jgi:hypothetical protein